MKPIVKNFTGNFKCGTRYRVRVVSDKENVTVFLETFKNGKWHYQTSELASLVFGYATALTNALKNAENAWGIKLLNTELNKVA